MKKFTVSLIIVLFISSVSIYAGGFQLNEHGARAKAMGNAFTALADDPSAVYWNGAGLSFIKGTGIMLGTHLIVPSSTFRGVMPNIDEYSTENQVFYPSHLFVSHTIDKSWAVGFGFTAPFGLGTKWDENWVGKYLAIETELQVFTLSPVVAWRPIENFSISAAFVYSFANVLITRKTSQTPFEGDAFVKLEGDDNASFGYNLGVMYKPLENVSFGASFHSQIDYTFEGTATTTGAQQLLDAKRLPNGDVTAELTTPISAAVGIAMQVTEDFTASMDFQYVGWSSYDTLAVDFADEAYSDIASPRAYRDTYILRLGGSYKANDMFTVLGGVYFDRAPVKKEYVNPSLPDADRLGFSIGLDAKFSKNFGITGSYLFIRSAELSVNDSEESYTPGFSPFNGVYNAYANVFSLSLSYYFN